MMWFFFFFLKILKSLTLILMMNPWEWRMMNWIEVFVGDHVQESGCMRGLLQTPTDWKNPVELKYWAWCKVEMFQDTEWMDWVKRYIRLDLLFIVRVEFRIQKKKKKLDVDEFQTWFQVQASQAVILTMVSSLRNQLYIQPVSHQVSWIKNLYLPRMMINSDLSLSWCLIHQKLLFSRKNRIGESLTFETCLIIRWNLFSLKS